MLLVLVLGVTLGLDSLRVCAVLALRDARSLSRTALPIAFGISDGLATWIGMLVGGSIVAAVDGGTEIAGAVALAGYGGWLCMKDGSTGAKAPTWLPLVLGLDNLGAGVALNEAATPVAAAAAMGGISAVMAALGLALGAAVARLIPASRVRRAAGWTLVAFAALMVVGSI